MTYYNKYFLEKLDETISKICPKCIKCTDEGFILKSNVINAGYLSDPCPRCLTSDRDCRRNKRYYLKKVMLDRYESMVLDILEMDLTLYNDRSIEDLSSLVVKNLAEMKTDGQVKR